MGVGGGGYSRYCLDVNVWVGDGGKWDSMYVTGWEALGHNCAVGSLFVGGGGR